MRVQLLLVDSISCREAGVAFQIKLGISELGFVLRFLGDGLIECRLVSGGINLGEDVSLGHVLAFREQDLHDLAVDLRANRHGVERFRSADPVEIDRHISRTRGDGEHGNGIGRGRNTAAAALRYSRQRRLPVRHVVDADHNRDDDAGNQEDRDSPFERHCITFVPAATPGGSQAPPSA